jgi:hypothetical protein
MRYKETVCRLLHCTQGVALLKKLCTSVAGLRFADTVMNNDRLQLLCLKSVSSKNSELHYL